MGVPSSPLCENHLALMMEFRKEEDIVEYSYLF
jgi:hypothetical protein